MISTQINRLLLLVSVFIGCSMITTTRPQLKNYKINHPDQTFFLPDTLHEVSGITMISDTEIACIQDENGIVFFYDVEKKKLKRQFRFGPDGDYEGIARVGSDLYVLRSDGVLFEIPNYDSKKTVAKMHVTNIPATDNEGLCFDSENKRLLIGCKSKPGKGPEYKDMRAVYAFDLVTKKTGSQPAYNFSVTDILQFALTNNVPVPYRTKKKGTEPVLKFATSELAIHPLTRELYLLSAADKMLFIFNPSGNLKHIEPLDKIKFNKPEGITFFENGDMLISNEGQDKRPTLLRFNYTN